MNKHLAKLQLEGRAAAIRDACRDRKIEPDLLTAAALVYQAMRIMKMPAERILDGPIILGLQAVLERLAAEAETPGFDPTDPDATITLTGTQLMSLLHAKLGDA